MIYRLRNPDLFHGRKKKRNFFEGWYFKLVDQEEKEVVALIPGLFLAERLEDSYSFIQFIHGNKQQVSFIRYPVTDFQAQKDYFHVRVASSTFSLQGISLNVDGSNLVATGSIGLHDIIKWPDTFINPGSMGFYNYLPRMQCYSQVCAMDLALSGALVVNGKKIDFTGGKGYIEKNWGSAFPNAWIWVQSNHFRTKNTSLSCSLGHIPFLWGSFKGFLIGLSVNDRFFTFTTMNRSRIRIQPKEQDAWIEAENGRYRLTMETGSQKKDYYTLYGPRDNQMVPFFKETVTGAVMIQLTDKRTDEILLSDIGRFTGIEYGGKRDLIFDSF